MRWENEKLILMRTPRTTYPVAEGVGIFVGIVAWDLLSDGQMDVIKAAFIAIPCSAVWFGVRWWRARSKNNPRK